MLEKFVYKGGVVPLENVDDYCTWFKITRSHRDKEKDNPAKVLRLQFEDMVYHYDESVKRIVDFLGISLNDHVFPLTKFIPSRSINNTQIWKRHPELAKEVNVIEEKLERYCYRDFV